MKPFISLPLQSIDSLILIILILITLTWALPSGAENPSPETCGPSNAYCFACLEESFQRQTNLSLLGSRRRAHFKHILARARGTWILDEIVVPPGQPSAEVIPFQMEWDDHTTRLGFPPDRYSLSLSHLSKNLRLSGDRILPTKYFAIGRRLAAIRCSILGSPGALLAQIAPEGPGTSRLVCQRWVSRTYSKNEPAQYFQTGYYVFKRIKEENPETNLNVNVKP